MIVFFVVVVVFNGYLFPNILFGLFRRGICEKNAKDLGSENPFNETSQLAKKLEPQAIKVLAI